MVRDISFIVGTKKKTKIINAVFSYQLEHRPEKVIDLEGDIVTIRELMKSRIFHQARDQSYNSSVSRYFPTCNSEMVLR